MANPQVNTIDIPVSMRSRGNRYDFIPRMHGTPNGYGATKAVGPQSLTWEYNRLTKTEIDWWLAFLSAAKSVELTQVQIWDHLQTLRTFSYAVFYEPRITQYKAGAYWGVQIEFQHIEPTWNLAATA